MSERREAHRGTKEKTIRPAGLSRMEVKCTVWLLPSRLRDERDIVPGRDNERSAKN